MKYILTILFFFSSICSANMIRVAVIDTGLKKNHTIPLCPSGHKDFTGTSLNDSLGHGTNVSYLINKYAKKAKYCQIIIKFYPAKNPLNTTLRALKYLTKINVDIINYSAGGTTFSRIEKSIIKKLIRQGKTFVTASGNEKTNLDKKCNFYPACYYTNIITVGNGRNGKPYNDSNYGNIVDVWIDGRSQSAGGLTKSGSSQSTAILTGKLIEYASQERQTSSEINRAIRMSRKAAYKQTGLDKIMKRFKKRMKKKLPKEVVKTSEIVYPLIKGIRDKKIHYKWEF